MSDLVARLSNGWHPVEVSVRPERTVEACKAAVDRGYVHVRFTGTRGGTELGVPVDLEASSFADADFAGHTGQFTLVGALTLDYVKVRCTATIDLASLTGQGRLEPVTQ
jgi:hypothetical protein